MKDDVVLGVLGGLPVGIVGVLVGEFRAWAYSVVICPGAEFVRVVGVEAMSDSEAEDGG